MEDSPSLLEGEGRGPKSDKGFGKDEGTPPLYPLPQGEGRYRFYVAITL